MWSCIIEARWFTAVLNFFARNFFICLWIICQFIICKSNLWTYAYSWLWGRFAFFETLKLGNIQNVINGQFIVKLKQMKAWNPRWKWKMVLRKNNTSNKIQIKHSFVCQPNIFFFCQWNEFSIWTCQLFLLGWGASNKFNARQVLFSSGWSLLMVALVCAAAGSWSSVVLDVKCSEAEKFSTRFYQFCNNKASHIFFKVWSLESRW